LSLIAVPRDFTECHTFPGVLKLDPLSGAAIFASGNANLFILEGLLHIFESETYECSSESRGWALVKACHEIFAAFPRQAFDR
jgi:hypothetical protein